MKITCHEITTPEDKQVCLTLRRLVFVEEQHVPVDREVDGLDAEARHFAAMTGNMAIGTCRVRLMGSAAKIERVAVLKDMRGRGIGKILMKYVLQELTRARDIQLLKLSSQADAIPFYEKLGFKTRGNEYMDAGIPHYDMVKEVNNVEK